MAIKIISSFQISQKEILQSPDERLRRVSKKVDLIDKTAKEIAEKLISILKKVDRPYKPWLGMAANQIGYDKRIIAIKKSYREYMIMVNPEVIEGKWNFYSVAGCFSLKGLYLLKRNLWQKVQYQDLNGNIHQKVFRGGYSSMLQQEIDHLNGKLISD